MQKSGKKRQEHIEPETVVPELAKETKGLLNKQEVAFPRQRIEPKEFIQKH